MAEQDIPPPTITAMKIPIIRKGEYDIWSMRMQQYIYAKSLWEAIKSRFGGNVESKKMQKNVLKHQFENFSTALNESLDKAYDRFQKLINCPHHRNKPDIARYDIDYHTTNSGFMKMSLKKILGLVLAGGLIKSTYSMCPRVAYSFACQPTTTQVDESFFSRWDGDDLEELDLRWQVAMLTVRVKKSTLLDNVDLKESREEDLGTMAGARSQQLAFSSQALVAPGEKVVKEIDELKDKNAKWEESTKNLDEILNSQMSARDKTGLGYGTQLNELSSNHETDSENSLSVFDVRSSLDEYAIRNKIIESQTTELNTKTSETAGKTNDANTEKPKSANESLVSNPKINRDRVNTSSLRERRSVSE
ncbi:hypothetical protein Tco_0286142 [Tanacetum coccineum]